MKLSKKIALLSVLGCLLFGCSLTKRPTTNMVHAEEIQVVFEEKVYNYEEENSSYVITLKTETEYLLEATNKENGMVLTAAGAYILEDNKLTLYEGNSIEVLNVFIVGEDGKTLTIYQEPEYIAPCQVITSNYDYGTIYVDKEQGEIGEIVTLHATPSLLCEVVEISVNGMILTANEDGNYTFVLVEGQNVVKAVFRVSNEQVSDVMALIKSLDGKTWEDLFTVENLIILITFILVTVFGSGLLIQLLKNKNASKQLAGDVNTLFKDETLNAITKITKEFLEEKFGPAFEKISGEMQSLDTVARTMANCFLLAQENTPESRLAIAKELTKLAETRKDLAEQVKEIINAQKEEIINNELQKRKAIEELEKENEHLLDDNTETSTSEGRY